MSLTKRWMEEQGMFEEDTLIDGVDDVDYEYIKWLASQYPNPESFSDGLDDKDQA
jgi:hypothetical protein